MRSLAKSSAVKALALAAGGALLLSLPHMMPSEYHRQILNQALIYIIVVSGYNFVTGDMGQLSLAQTGFFAIGGYTSALLATRAGCPFWLALPASAITAALFGAIIGIPTLKLRGQYLVMVTMAFSEILRLILTNWDTFTGGSSGISKIPVPSFGPYALTTKTQIYYLMLVATAGMMLITWRIRNSHYGRLFRAVRDAELAVSVSGVNVTSIKMLAFILSALYGGVAGSLYVFSFLYISPETFGMGQIIIILSMLLIGGAGTMGGPIVGAILLTYLPEWLRFVKQYYMLAFGIGVLLMALFMPGGIVGSIGRYWATRAATLLVPAHVEKGDAR